LQVNCCSKRQQQRMIEQPVHNDYVDNSGLKLNGTLLVAADY
jgi:hypothetical protein